MKSPFLLFLFFLLPGFMYGQIRKYSNEFLNIGIGARALGMSNVQVAIANDVTAGYWNPAGLLNLKNKYEVALMHSEQFASIAKNDYAGFATRLDSNSVIALTVIRFGVDDIPNTLNLFDNNGAVNYNNITYFSVSDYGFLLSYARKSNVIPGLKLGANFKVIHRIVGDFADSWGFGLDAGAQYVYKGWQLGLMARDITGTFNAWSHNPTLTADTYTKLNNDGDPTNDNIIPQNSIEIALPRLIAGIGRNIQLHRKVGLLVAADMDFTFDGKRNVLIKTNAGSIDPHIGLEIDYIKVVFLRLGAGNVQQIKDFDNKKYTSFQPNFGVGVKINRFTIDYALTDIGDKAEALYSNVFSLKIGF